jgi:hypothetical protein
MTWHLPEYRLHPFLDLTNPLLLLLTGPADPVEIVRLALVYMPSLEEYDVQQFMINLDEQNDAGCKLLVPYWWLEAPAKFWDQITWYLCKPAVLRISLAEQQEEVLWQTTSVWCEQ